MRILIAVPTFETIAPECFKAIYDLDTAGHTVDFEFVKGYDCAVARNEIGKKAKAYDYVLMVDSDTIIPKDTLTLFLDHPTKIVAGICPRKNTKTEMTAMVKTGQQGYGQCYTYSELDGIRMAVKAAGFACVLIDTEVFDLLPFPWFRFVSNPDGSTFSEDYYFCEQAIKAGMAIEADTRVRCGHLARYFQWR